MMKRMSIHTMKESSLQILHNLVERYMTLEACRSDLHKSLLLLLSCYRSGGKVLTCGNGGSAADAEHIVGELMKGFVLPRTLHTDMQTKLRTIVPARAEEYIRKLQQPLTAIALTNHVSLSTAFANDQASEMTFAQQVLGYGRKDDVLICISTSGNSRNVVCAAEIARCLDMHVISLTGQSGGKLAALSDAIVRVPEKETYKIQEYHLPIYHMLCLATENEFFGPAGAA